MDPDPNLGPAPKIVSSDCSPSQPKQSLPCPPSSHGSLSRSSSPKRQNAGSEPVQYGDSSSQQRQQSGEGSDGSNKDDNAPQYSGYSQKQQRIIGHSGEDRKQSLTSASATPTDSAEACAASSPGVAAHPALVNENAQPSQDQDREAPARSYAGFTKDGKRSFQDFELYACPTCKTAFIDKQNVCEFIQVDDFCEISGQAREEKWTKRLAYPYDGNCFGCDSLNWAIRNVFKETEKIVSCHFTIKHNEKERNNKLYAQGSITVCILIESGHRNSSFSAFSFDATFVIKKDADWEDEVLQIEAILESGNGDECIDWMKKCLAECKTSHPNEEKRKNRLEKLQGFRLIDTENLCLKEINSGDKIPEYAALSYMWEPQQQQQNDLSRLTEAFRENLLQPGSLKAGNIRPLLWNCIQLCQKLNMKYLWIDRFCIIQHGDDSDKPLQLQFMDEIYKQASFTLICALDSNTSEHLPGIHEPYSDFHVLDLPPSLKYCHINEVDEITNSGRWNNRGWTFQEKIFSSHCFYFSSKFTLFQCTRGLSQHLNFPNMDTDSVSQLFEETTVRFAFEFVLSRPHDDYTQNMLSLSNKRDCLASFSELIEEYSHRNLSFPSDRLNAFMGIVNHYQRLWKTPFLSGIPRKYFPAALLWRRDPDVQNELDFEEKQKREDETRSEAFKDKIEKHSESNKSIEDEIELTDIYPTDPTQLKFPSWSWASLSGGVSYNRIYHTMTPSDQRGFELLAHVDPDHGLYHDCDDTRKQERVNSAVQAIVQHGKLVRSSCLVFDANMAPVVSYKNTSSTDQRYLAFSGVKPQAEEYFSWYPDHLIHPQKYSENLHVIIFSKPARRESWFGLCVCVLDSFKDGETEISICERVGVIYGERSPPMELSGDPDSYTYTSTKRLVFLA